jgi:hypothetical protein
LVAGFLNWAYSRMAQRRRFSRILGFDGASTNPAYAYGDPGCHTLIEETVVSGSVQTTDDFSLYRGLERLGWKHHRLNHSKRMWSDDEGRSTASIDLVWRWLKRDLAGRTGQIAQEDLWKYIKQFLFKFHAQSHPAEAYWRLVSTYPPPERYVEETFRREVDCRWRWPRAAAGLPASEDASRWDWRPRRPTRRKSGD